MIARVNAFHEPMWGILFALFVIKARMEEMS
jgi:hypothetical protein